MITPAFVSTIKMSARYFGRIPGTEPPIDLLFFDEAGQLSPESAAAPGILARKVVAIGDTEQLAPYSKIPEHLDAMLMESTLGKSDSYSTLAREGFSASNSSFLQRATRTGQLEDGSIVGAALREHRRSVPEIVEFCNSLSYRGRLKAMRPELKERILPVFRFLPRFQIRAFDKVGRE